MCWRWSWTRSGCGIIKATSESLAYLSRSRVQCWIDPDAPRLKPHTHVVLSKDPLKAAS